MNPHAASDLVRNPRKLCDLISLTQQHASSPPLSSRVMAATMCARDDKQRRRGGSSASQEHHRQTADSDLGPPTNQKPPFGHVTAVANGQADCLPVLAEQAAEEDWV